MPPIADLRRGARPFVSYSYWQGDDYVTECHSDRSMLVNACGVVGAASPIFPLVGAAIGAAAAQEHHGGFHEMTDLIPLIP